MKFHGIRPDNSLESENWSGYAVTGSSFTQAEASWVVPTANCAVTPGNHSSPTYSSFWVGIDGFSSSTVEQIGTDSDCDGNSPTYYAWFEFYPHPSYEILGLRLSPGNKISAAVNYSGSSFTVKITNVTTGQYYSTTQTVNGAARSSVEWIAEAPCCTRSGAFLPLSDFGTVAFGVDSTNVNNTNYATEGAAAGTGGSTTGPIGSFPTTSVQQINMVSSSGAAEDTTSSLSSDGTSFSVTWKSE